MAAPVIFAASSNPLDQACSQGTASTSPICKDAATKGSTDPIAGPGGVISKAANIIALITGIGAVLMILIGSFEYITAGGSPVGQRSGDPNRAKQAKARIVSALIGLVVVALAWAIVRLVTDRIIR